MQKRTVKIEYLVVVEYDEKSPEFRDTLSDYREAIDPEATAESMVLNAAYRLQRGGFDRMLEGVGFIQRIGDGHESQCGIWAEDDDPLAEIEFID